MRYRNPKPTVDLYIQLNNEGVVLIRRKNPPDGWALPGGFVDEGESLEAAAIREAKEETGLDVELVEQFFTYSDPKRDPRQHVMTTVFIARAYGTPHAGDDASLVVQIKDPASLVTSSGRQRYPLVFDHQDIVQDVLRYRKYGTRRKLPGRF